MARLTLATLAVVTIIALGCASPKLLKSDEQATAAGSQGLTIKQDEQAGTISVFRAGKAEPILTQNARPDTRPYLHPIAAPDGKGVLTEVQSGTPQTPDRPLLGLHAASTAATISTTREGTTGGACRRRSCKPSGRTKSDGRPSTTCWTQRATRS